MKIFIDTANLDQIKEINSWGIVDGVTTNPSLIAKEGVDVKTRIKEIAETVAFLASERARYITGQVIAVDGGMSIGC